MLSSKAFPSLSALACALVLAGCGGGGGGDTTKTGEEGGSAKTFQAPDVAFTFKYPGGFTQENEDDGKVLATVLPDPHDTNNAIKVRQTAARELPLSSYLDELRRQFAQQLGRVDRKIERRSGLEMGVLSFSSPTTLREGGTTARVTVNSASYFFAGGGKTWQVECLSTDAHRAEIDRACRQAMDSVSF